MDNSAVPAADRRPILTYGPDRRLAAGFGVAALMFLALAVTADDAAGRLLYGLAAVVLLVLGVGDLVISPRLIVDPAGLRVRSALSTAQLAWLQLESVTVDERSRLGLTGRTLEIDAGDRLIVLSGRALGADPRVVADAIAAMRPAPGV